ncbi:MAG: heavy metal-binding domain-containing protein [Bacteroidales bacterium]|nr:heavy metal-binding domain-containing protein [Bacteroidales bacterium]
MKAIALIAIVTVMITVTGCSYQGGNPDHDNNHMSSGQLSYTCPMHPEVVADNPGKCPKCGMELVKQEMPADTVHQMHNDSMIKMQH